LDFDLKSLFGTKTPPLIGVDISTSGIKLVELSMNDKGVVQLECFASEPIPRGAIVDGGIENLEQVSDALQLAWRKSGTNVKNVALAMPSAAVITKKVVMPDDLSEEEMSFQVESEARQYIPFGLDEVNLDYYKIGPSHASPGDADVMLAAARKEKVEDRIAIAESAGLKPVVMDIESYAAHSATNRVDALTSREKSGQIVALFRIGSLSTHLSVLIDGEAVYEREQAFGGNQLTQDIVRTYGLAYEEAEMKKRAGSFPEDYQKTILRPFMENIAQEVTRAIQFFFTSSPYTRVDTIYLAGGCANIDGLSELISSRTRVKTSVINPFKGIVLATRVKEKLLHSEEPSYLVACGLAMRRFDK
jgi:type IV pilus assembly protein PilM